jgi:hypothetical protein
MKHGIAALALATLVLAAEVGAQGVDGSVSVMTDVLPAVRQGSSEATVVTELRTRVFLERRFDLADRVRITASGFADGLLADRGADTVTTAGILRPQELHLELAWRRGDLRIGLSRLVWGRLDEFLPTDVINPLDLARFFLEGRIEARMPVAMARGRWIPTDRFTLEAVLVPFFRRGTFDQLDESTSPFNLALRGPLVVENHPPNTLRQAQGGARASFTSGRVDWSLAAYRGMESLPVYAAGAVPDVMPGPNPTPPAVDLTVREEFPRFTMIGGDFETVRGQWGVRAEVAAFVDRTLQASTAPAAVEGESLEAGVGVDRRAGDYRMSGNVVLARRWADPTLIDRTDISLVAALDRSFARETRSLRAFGVYNPGERSAFGRVIASFSLRDNVALELSGGLFSGDGADVLSLLASRDFVYARLKVFF